jgi:hypothetical protein
MRWLRVGDERLVGHWCYRGQGRNPSLTRRVSTGQEDLASPHPGRSAYCRREPTHAMTRELRQETKIQLALAIAQGRSVALWARDVH